MKMKSIEKYLKTQIDQNKTPGLQYYYFNQDTILYRYCGGLADIDGQTEVNEDTTFNACSTTKTLTALAIIQLVEKGLIEIDKPVSAYLQKFPYPGNITTRHLLTHTSGIPNPLPLKWIHAEDEHDDFDYKKYFSKVFQKHNKTRNGPGEKFAYSNLGYILGDVDRRSKRSGLY
ncbi:serine hydrolase domain-containing protein [Bacteroidota bacterium]